MRPGSSCSRGGHSGLGNGSDEERKRQKRPAPADPVRAKLVASDAGRKRGARAYMNWLREAPPAYTRRGVEEYDRQMEMAAAARGTGSSSGARSSAITRAPLPPPKREEEEQQGAAPRAGRGFLPGDFVDDVDLDWVTAEVGYHNSPEGIMRLLESAEFCLEPCGDSFTRKSTFDAILTGCIPVFFHPISAYTQYTWHLPRDYRSYSVFIPQAHVANGNATIEEVLRKIPRDKVARMREEVIRLIPRVMYRDPTANGVVFRDAFDVAVDAVIDRVRKLWRAAAEGRQYNDSVNGHVSWKYDLLEHEQKDIGPHEFDPYM